MVFDAREALMRFGASHTTAVLWKRFDVSHREMFDTLEDAIVFIRNDRSAPTHVELHVHRGGHDVLIEGEELEKLIAQYQTTHS